MLDIAAAETSIKAGDIAAQHSIPASYLNNVLFELRRLGLVTSKKGANGGYQLARTPDQINLLQLHQGLAGASPLEQDSGASGALLWLQQLEARWLSELERTYLSDVQSFLATGNRLNAVDVKTSSPGDFQSA